MTPGGVPVRNVAQAVLRRPYALYALDGPGRRQAAAVGCPHDLATGPGGVHIFDKEGKHLGTLATGEATSNCAFGEDGSTLFITADMYVLRLRLKVKGTGF